MLSIIFSHSYQNVRLSEHKINILLYYATSDFNYNDFYGLSTTPTQVSRTYDNTWFRHKIIRFHRYSYDALFMMVKMWQCLL